MTMTSQLFGKYQGGKMRMKKSSGNNGMGGTKLEHPHCAICLKGHEKDMGDPPKNPGKVGKVMHEFKHGTLRSGSKHGPKVKSRAQAIAIGMSEAGM